MSDRHWLRITSTTGPIGLGLSLVSNSILLFLLSRKWSPIIGTYKKLLIFFCFFTMYYSTVEMVLGPLIHIYDDTLFLIYEKRFDMSPEVSKLFPTTYCFCCAVSFNLFALQFVFRYVATCRPKNLDYFIGYRFFLWILSIIFIAATWQVSAYVFFPKTDRTEESFVYLLMDSYGLEVGMKDYVPYKYYYYDEDLVKRVNMLSFMGILQHGLVITVSFSVLFFCGIRTFLKIRSHTGISSKTRELQLQLFRALVAQTFIPMIFMYIPVGFMFSCPYFDLQLGAKTNFETVMAQLYPGVDPCVLLFLIDAYRSYIIKLLVPKGLHKVSCVPAGPTSFANSTTVF